MEINKEGKLEMSISSIMFKFCTIYQMKIHSIQLNRCLDVLILMKLDQFKTLEEIRDSYIQPIINVSN